MRLNDGSRNILPAQLSVLAASRPAFFVRSAVVNHLGLMKCGTTSADFRKRRVDLSNDLVS